MIPRTSQYHPGHEIPEKNWYYRIAKRFLFNDFGVYNGRDHSKTAAPYIVNAEVKPAASLLSMSGGCCSGETACDTVQTVTLGTPVDPA